MSPRTLSVTLAICCSLAGAKEPWHTGLYRGGGGVWLSRAAVTVRNAADRVAEGTPVALRVGQAEGQLPLAGARAESVRVCMAGGQEVLFDLTAESGRAVTSGPIPAGATLTLPAECPAGSAARYYVYYGNPQAGILPDWLGGRIGVANGGFEGGEGNTPAGWQRDEGDAEHRIAWVTEGPHAGKRCLKTTVAAGAETTWIGTRQGGIHVVGGQQYVFEGWVRGEGVRGGAGWFVHVGNAGNSQMLNRTVTAGEGTFGWRKVRIAFTAPAEADTVMVGTFLRGTGTAWHDDASLSAVSKPRLTARAGAVEHLELRAEPAGKAWHEAGGPWPYRAVVSVTNLTETDHPAVLVRVNRAQLARRLHLGDGRLTAVVVRGDKAAGHFNLPDGLLFQADLPARTVRQYCVYFRPGGKAQGDDDYARLLASKLNLAANPSFESGQTTPDDWPGSAEGQRPKGVAMGVQPAGRFGRQAAWLHVPENARASWVGWRQDVKVRPGRTYFYGAWLKTKNVAHGAVQLHAHYRNATGGFCKTKQFAGVNKPLTGDTDWTFLGGLFDMPPDIGTFQLHLTMNATGTVWHDGVVLCEAHRGQVVSLERRVRAGEADLAVWPVNAVVKVFPDDLPPDKPQPAALTAARNEYEPLQLAVRSRLPRKGVRVVAGGLRLAGAKAGEVLPAPEVGVVGFVPIDYPTNYYRDTGPRWHRKVPSAAPGCDGWAGDWPDPVLPRDTFDLTPGRTQPLWITYRAGKSAAPGEYRGLVKLTCDGKTLLTVPVALHVWNFTLPDRSRVKAIYDARFGPRGSAGFGRAGETLDQTFQRMWRFMARRRLCPDTIRPIPKIRYTGGKVVADFTEFDKAAALYFDELKLPHAYTPWSFYLFGWGHPPAAKFGQQPYEGTWPFDGVDRSKLRPEFKKAYQACLRAYWEHVKAKGWADKILFYISDEPFFHEKHIIEQMKALCAMIHEVDPKIPIYSSTWSHVPAWDGSLDVWGLGHYGRVPVATIRKLEASGKRILWTTDGQMCTDTPYCAVERLLPHFCFHYGAEGYEFWGVAWLTYNPYEFGWHSYIRQSSTPGKYYWVRYPNGDGFLIYPGNPVGHDGFVTSIRLEQAREGVEDGEYLYMLRDRLTAVEKQNNKNARTRQAISHAKAVLKAAAKLAPIPNAGGRYSSKVLPDPDAVFRTKRAVAKAIEGLE